VNPWIFFAIGSALVLTTKKALGFSGGKPVEVELAGIGGGFWLRKDAAAAFNRMSASAAAAGVRLTVNRAFATMDEQESLYEKYLGGTGNLAAKPGFSNHQQGLAVDLDVGGTVNSTVYKWLKSYGMSYGFKNTGIFFSQAEPWHWEYMP
jgi:LAS superfamily LD-carboxypeptidase LdcB